MADDTRIAEACLLLNYSNQVSRDLSPTVGCISHENQSNKVGVEPHGRNHLSGENVQTKMITPPPEHDYAAECEEKPTASDQYTRENLPSSSTADTSLIVEPPLDEVEHYSSNGTDREPLNNLLAAVNCVLPRIKGRPNILQRSTAVHMPSSSHTRNLSPPDHNYCQQDIGFVDNEQYLSANNETGHTDRSSLKSSNGPNSSKIDPNIQRKSDNSTLLEIDRCSTKPLKFVAIHLGAGNCSNEAELSKLARAICEEVMFQSSSCRPNQEAKRKRKTIHGTGAQVITNNCGECQNNPRCYTTIKSAEAAVVQLIKKMEDIPSLNCGYGSNLTIKGQVECDASLMSDKTQMWAGVGAVSGCKNPILLAKSLYDHRTVPRPLGLIQPNLLVGSGAKQWMREHCPDLIVMDSKLISPKALSTYQTLKSRYDSEMRTSCYINRQPKSAHGLFIAKNTGPGRKESILSRLKAQSVSANLDHGLYCASSEHIKRESASSSTAANLEKRTNQNCDREKESSTQEPHLGMYDADSRTEISGYKLDTVGAIAVDCDDNFASAISSGGLLLKYKGRVGQAAVPGAGCWSEDSIAVTTTGVGEFLTLSLFARKFHDKMLTLRLLYDLGYVDEGPDLSDPISCGMNECFEELLNSPALSQVPMEERLAGILSVSTLNSKYRPERVSSRDLYLTYAHNTNAMCIGYMTCNDTVARSVVSKKVDQSDDNVIVRTIKFSLDSSKADV